MPKLLEATVPYLNRGVTAPGPLLDWIIMGFASESSESLFMSPNIVSMLRSSESTGVSSGRSMDTSIVSFIIRVVYTCFSASPV